MNGPKFNSKNRIFLSCTCGKPENCIWEMYDKNTQVLLFHLRGMCPVLVGKKEHSVAAS